MSIRESLCFIVMQSVARCSNHFLKNANSSKDVCVCLSDVCAAHLQWGRLTVVHVKLPKP